MLKPHTRWLGNLSWDHSQLRAGILPPAPPLTLWQRFVRFLKDW